MTIEFTKMHGLGNDFIVIDAINQSINLSAENIRKLANRHTGVGFDQLLLVEKPQTRDVDFNYRIYNADGGEVGQCGNGARCLAQFIHDTGLSDKKELTVATFTRKMQIKLLDDNLVSACLGVPTVDINHLQHISLDGQNIAYFFVDVGNPHAVIRVPDVADADVADIGLRLNQHSAFPGGVNVGFMEIIDPEHIRLRVYERGTGETQSCGSGACAAVVAGKLIHQLNSSVTVTLLGGDLRVEWAGSGEPVWLVGPAESVFKGVII